MERSVLVRVHITETQRLASQVAQALPRGGADGAHGADPRLMFLNTVIEVVAKLALSHNRYAPYRFLLERPADSGTL